MPLIVTIFLLCSCTVRLCAQGLSTSRIESATGVPLVIANRAPAGQPIVFLAGASGSVRSLEVDATGATWIKGPLSIGDAVGAHALEQLRIGSVAQVGGYGGVISLLGTTQSTGLLIRDVGVSGPDNAGLVLQSVANGTGTGMRIGGPAGAQRPTFSTGIDVTGGTGFRYNALSSGSGSAIEIGGTTAPRRGIEITTAGTDHIGVVSVANTGGAGIIGVSRSSAYTDIPPTKGIGVRGHAATNSTASADTVVGLFGSAQRGGTGGTQTTTVGMHARAESAGSAHAGTAIAILGSAVSTAPGRAAAISAMFHSASDGLSLATFGGDVLLGCSDEARPSVLDRSTASAMDTKTTTHIYNSITSGTARVTMLELRSGGAVALAAGNNNDVRCEGIVIVRLDCTNGVCEITGFADGSKDRVIIIVARRGNVTLRNESPLSEAANRLRLPQAADAEITADSGCMLWYDAEISRWRIIDR